MKEGDLYNFIGQSERLVFVGKVGRWNQFERVDHPDIVWCEVTDDDLDMLEVTDE